ncbi:Beta-L-arabinofuranosidase, GH127 [Pseudobutyrivibrio ruminis]|uniref:Beta-L-arabinofuranosidase, GH127 n=1 Tax=Pseudobutyrivibrio ruminis TaxID=46206 RepID=A0A1H7L0X0_9FIRM|nr:Beta-L-arabinofuranosidase, GH127 [Pseudobutyrivibrio ruminis]
MKYKANSSIPIKNIKITDKFWNKYRDLVGEVIIPYQWDVLNDRLKDVETSHCIENFKIAAGLSNGNYEGAVFQDTDLAKWLEAVGFYLSSYGRDEKLEALADEAIDLIEKAQQPDGYLDTYFIINAPDKKWKNLCEGHELYTAGHFMEAAVAYFEATGKRKILDIVCHLADLLCSVFGDGKDQCHGYPGHPEV